MAVGIAALVLAGVAEGCVEVLLRNPASIPEPLLETLRQYYGEHGRTIIHAIPSCARYDPGLLYTLRPGECRFRNREFDTRVAVNSLGVRDDEASLDGPEIVVLGDSYAMGWGVERDDTFARRIELATGKRVLNAGVASYGTARELKLLERVLDRVDAGRLETLIVQYNFTDVGENRAYYEGGGRLPTPEEGRYEGAVSAARSRSRYFPGKHVLTVTAIVIRDILGAAIPALRGTAAGRETAAGSVAPASDEPSRGRNDEPGREPGDEPGEARLFLNVVREMARRLDGGGGYRSSPVEILVFELSPAETLGRAFTAAVREELEKPEFGVLRDRVRLLDVAERIGPEQTFILDEHLNAAGHAVVAETVVEALSDRAAPPESGSP